MRLGLKRNGPDDPGRASVADVGLLALRLGAGSLLAGHGAQKLFGSFQGPGLQGFGGALGSLGLQPAQPWAVLGGLSEFGGGTLLALGLGGPIGPLALQGAMLSAIRRAHWKLPLWVSSGGAELALLYALIGAAVATTGPGRYSLDHALGLKVPPVLSLATALSVAAGLALAEAQVAAAAPAEAATPAADADAATELDPLAAPEGGVPPDDPGTSEA